MNLKQDELILAVKKDIILPKNLAWQGLQINNSEKILDLINNNQDFLLRSCLETDPNYKQIISYMIFKHKNKYFLTQRKSSASEQRLKNKYSLGIGGHIKKEDVNSNSAFDWTLREFEEEIFYDGNLKISTIGFLNDDSNAVGQVHLGMVLLLEGDSPNIQIKSELKSGTLTTLAECQMLYKNMESWSQIVLDFLLKESLL
ncbi:MAG: NUDIX hydrolase [candidate division TM6 bacterium GW2011_GWF2_32_72]|nr:MAG: NUDIX hydrolase [candidate division TM6 bacterium GW2011_GWF2_32_72]